MYVDLECLLVKINTCQNNLEKSYTEMCYYRGNVL